MKMVSWLAFLREKKQPLIAGENKYIIIIIIIIIDIFFFFFFHGLGLFTCSGIDPLPSFLWSSRTSSSLRIIFEGVFRQSGVAHSFKMVDPVLFVFGFHILYSRDFRNYPEYLQEGPRKPTNISEQPISEIRFCVINS